MDPDSLLVYAGIVDRSIIDSRSINALLQPLLIRFKGLRPAYWLTHVR
jgi:hypothetical protein